MSGRSIASAYLCRAGIHSRAFASSIERTPTTSARFQDLPLPTRGDLFSKSSASTHLLSDHEYKLYAKRSIPSIFRKYAPRLVPHSELYYAAACVFPMRVNNYVLDNLIDWSKVPDDPIFQLVFPQPGMLPKDKLHLIQSIVGPQADKGSAPMLSKVQQQSIIEKELRGGLNPHPAGQKEMNVPTLNGQQMEGIQHKYRETALFFPSQGQYCHAFCTYCFRWAQFTTVGSGQQFKSGSPEQLRDYVANHKDVTDVLITGGDPMVMKARHLDGYVSPILDDPRCAHLRSIRIGTKSLAYWPHRYVNDVDSEQLLHVLDKIGKSGRHVSIMAHFSHPRQLETPVCQEAIRRIRETGAQIRCQAPLIRGVNDDASLWARMWTRQVQLGMVPYYMFVERDTGAKDYFSVPLARALDIYNEAVSSVSGLGRTVRGPSMSAGPGKVHVVGRSTIGNQDVFVLRFLQSRNPAWSKQLFYAKFDPQATWLDDLEPAWGQEKWFWQDDFTQMGNTTNVDVRSSGQLFPASLLHAPPSPSP